MIIIMLLALRIIAVLFFLGIGFTYIFIPRRLQRYAFWLTPWIGTVLMTVFVVMFNLAKIPVNKSIYFVVFMAFVFLLTAMWRKKLNVHFSRVDILLSVLIIASMIFNLYPLMKKAGFPTTISKSNLDPITYSMVGDFLVDHTIFDGQDFEHYKPYLWAVGDLLHSSFRWGSPLILSFFAQLLALKSYEIFSIIITVYFVLSIPLVYVLAKVLMPALKMGSALFLTIIFSFNSTLLYMLYNAFFAQFIFMGIFVVMAILFCDYIDEKKKKTSYNRWDFLIALCLSSLTTIYPEGLIFVSVPFLIFAVLDSIFRKRLFFLIVVAKIGILVFLINPLSFGTATRQIRAVGAATSKAVFIGWEKIPYAAPLEILGFYNLYYSRDLSVIFDIILGLPVVIVIILGISRSKAKLFLVMNIVFFVLIYFIYRLVFPNYYTYHKAITYTVFLYMVFFGLGVNFLFGFLKSKLTKTIIVIVFLIFSARSAYRTIYQLYWHPYIVDASLVSLRSLSKDKQMNKPFFTADVYLGEYDLWKRIWREYLLMDKSIVTRQNYQHEKKNLQDVRLVLAEKEYLEREGKKLVYKHIVWENNYYQLGEIEPVSIASDLLKY